MPSKSEIDFCEMWSACGVGSDAPSRRVAAWVIPRLRIPGVGCGDWERAGLLHRDTIDEPWHITTRGADLVASFESALALDLEIKPDPGPGMRPPWDPAPVRKTETRVVCDCDDGFVGIPIAYGAKGGCSVEGHERGGVIEVWPAKCPKCNVERGRPGVDLVWEPMFVEADIGRPIEGLDEILDDKRAAWIAGTGAPIGETWVTGRAEMLRLVGPWMAFVGESADYRPSDPPYDPVITAVRRAAGSSIGVIDNGWRQLTRVEAERLAGKPFEARRGLDDPPRHHVAMSAQQRPTYLRLVGGGSMRFDGTWWVRDAVAP